MAAHQALNLIERDRYLPNLPMKVKKELKIPMVEIYCDLCKSNIRDSYEAPKTVEGCELSPGSFHVNPIKADYSWIDEPIAISQSVTYNVDLRTKCWLNKLIPWLESQGADIHYDWDFGHDFFKERYGIMKRIVKSCKDCPFLYKNSEFPEIICTLINKDWGMGYYTKGPAPDWCPLRKGNAIIKLAPSSKSGSGR